MIKTHALRFGFVAAAALAVACSSSGGSDGGTDAGNSGGTDAGGTPDSGMMVAGMTYCDGFGAVDSTSGDTVLVETYSFGKALETEGCDDTVEAFADKTAITQVGGIYDLDTSDNAIGAVIYPANCGDLGLPGFTQPTGTTITPPTGISTVAAAIVGGQASTSLYGVVTAIYPWRAGGTITEADGGTYTETAAGGTIYVQDATASGATPAPSSGIEIYVPKAADAIMAIPVVGNVVSFTGLKWSPYKGANQFEASAASVVTVLGTSPLPTPVMLTPAEVGTTALASPTAEGMRVIVSGSFKVSGSETSGTCPAGVSYTEPAGG